MGDEPGEGPGGGQAGEPVGVAEPAADLAGEDLADTGGGEDDPVGVGLAVEVEDPLGRAARSGAETSSAMLASAAMSAARASKSRPVGPHSARVASAAVMTASARSVSPRLAGVVLEPAGQPGPARAA